MTSKMNDDLRAAAEPHIVVLSGICGHHFDQDCLGCTSSRELNDRLAREAASHPPEPQQRVEVLEREPMSNAEMKALWVAHGGRQYGPNVEQYCIEEQAWYRFAREFEQKVLERDTLKSEIERFTLDGIHSCGPDCQRRTCVVEREIACLRAYICDADAAMEYGEELISSEVAKLSAEREEFRLALLNLLAIIHRDGGHKTQELGWKLATEQAERISSERIAERDTLTEANRVLVEAFSELLATHDEDEGMDDFDDNDSVGAYKSEDGEIHDLPLTFGILRRARAAVAQSQRPLG